MKKLLLLFIAVVFLTGCSMGNLKSAADSEVNQEAAANSEEVREGINFKDKTLRQILPGFPEDIITLIEKQELARLSHLYYFKENDFVNMTGDVRDTCYSVDYVSGKADDAFLEYQEMFSAKPGEDPKQFDAVTGNYFVRIRILPDISTLYINCYTQIGEEYKEEKLDELVTEYSPPGLIKSYMRKEVMKLPESTSYVFEYTFDADAAEIVDFYKSVIPDAKEETRNDVIYIEDSVIGTEIAQYIAIDSKFKTVTVDVATYQY